MSLGWHFGIGVFRLEERRLVGQIGGGEGDGERESGGWGEEVRLGEGNDFWILFAYSHPISYYINKLTKTETKMPKAE